MTTPGGDQTRCCQELASRQEITARSRILTVRARVTSFVTGSKGTGFNVTKDLAPELHALTDSKCVCMRRTFLRARQDMQAAKNDLCATLAIPARQLEGAFGEGKVNAYADNLRKRIRGRRPLQQVFVPVGH